MNCEILSDALRYIDFLRSKHYSVSLSCFADRFAPYTAELLQYEIHTHAVCDYMKICKSTVGKCIRNKRQLEQLQLTQAVFTCCYVGVEEYMVPIYYGDEFLMFVHISGYRGHLERSIQNYKKMSDICGEKFDKLYRELEEKLPDEKEIMNIVNPLKYIIVALYQHCQNSKRILASETMDLYLRGLKYIHENYMYSISCETMARELNYSASYLRYVFKKEGNITLNSKINDVRLERAGQLLRYTKLSITEIAGNCGFSDSNYFSVIFKKKFGKTPKEYRKNVA